MLSFKLVLVVAVAVGLTATNTAAAVVTLGQSTQNFGLTGLGPDARGNGQSKVSFGTCAYDGTNTACTISGAYTGLNGGGAYSFVVSYPGNGAFPLIAVTVPGSDLFTFSANSNFNFLITLTPNSGPPVNFYSFYAFNVFYTAAHACTGIAAANCSTGSVGQTAGATITGLVTGSFDPTPVINPNQVITASGYGGFSSAAPASWIEIYGFNLATVPSRIWSADFVGNQAPSALAGTTVTIAGKPAYILYVASSLTSSQVNVQVPDGVPSGPQPLVVTTAGGSSVAYMLNINTVQPGLLAIPAFVFNGFQNVVALFSSNLTTFVYPTTIPGVTTARARAGDRITLYGIGFGVTTPALPAGQIVQQANSLNGSLRILFGDVPATISYAGLGPGNVGLYQFNVTVPSVAAGDAVPVTFTLNGTPGLQKLYIAIQ
jgi:uncharacterized protein (TIGR03437 family)